ncbi:MAG: alpha/beta-type small acid-soluble spore protein [Clostridium sp.]|uniref:alpha/beta-type small acid-soluble spore protein n=1 Tax=Clostridium sp. TaxID=1506 RepID=UPI0025C48B14|nr:alpha/beta-type small acid-soluble spore protein [Clostridium sp.]MCH3962755.1 alpha/beta-type small acid-soluble spore protein [Clostridium sp.]MCI1715830.1 alpha/beta-type small acid-soluble spore protein [Clostridium sp.]MCI1799965.1 alpha/beta-type small acid-soluble spore protein [Clostridium sp.]MCI1813879.1 alpha/beta-type small acid-soluble spore protein [Clostridium sp.]MCI1870777.1 alpha/beta-type small acid-soluble spore protein [Clostridium sp.]
MSRKNKILVPEARQGLEKLKIESAEELAKYNKSHNPEQQVFSIGGQMVKKMVESYEKKLK